MEHTSELKQQILQAALPHVPFDGWSDTALQAAAQDCGVAEDAARALFPRGALDLAVAFHQDGDRRMAEQLAQTDLSQRRFRDRIAFALRTRLELVEDKELVRRGSTLFALPQHAGQGASLIWGTCDLIWSTLGDCSDDLNWYSKRATLSAVYSALVLYWLGDDSEGNDHSWAFLERRIENVMRFEKLKSDLNDNKMLKPLLAVPGRLFGAVRAPSRRNDLPGQFSKE